ncbi:uncharacterized protein [Narcine bancroftii]|uniref:uncharacterized protein isoform X1 n=1 Tax=Narcine bancroftii TaxID=1343680 RepID=UPI0038322B9B
MLLVILTRTTRYGGVGKGNGCDGTFRVIRGYTTYKEAMNKLQKQYRPRTNEVYMRHLLATHKQQPGESLKEYFQVLHEFGQACNCRDVTADVYTDKLVWDTCVAGSDYIRQWLLEQDELTLQWAFKVSKMQDAALHNTNSFYSDNAATSWGMWVLPFWDTGYRHAGCPDFTSASAASEHRNVTSMANRSIPGSTAQLRKQYVQDVGGRDTMQKFVNPDLLLSLEVAHVGSGGSCHLGQHHFSAPREQHSMHALEATILPVQIVGAT